MENSYQFDSRAALFKQAQLRAVMVLGGIGAGILFGGLGVPRLITPETAAVAFVHASYTITTYLLLRRNRSAPAERFMIATAMMDALMVFAWIMVFGKYGILFTPFFNFSTLGYGVRTGNRKVLIYSQVASLLFVCLVPLLSEYWRDHLLVWSSIIIGIVIVPWYAARLTQQFRDAIQSAEQESHAKSELLARVSHELRTPLGGIVNAVEILEKQVHTDHGKDIVKTILHLSEHLLGDINDLIDQSRMTFGKMELHEESQSISGILDTVRAAVQARAEAKGLFFHLSIDPRINRAFIVDAHWLSRVLINLAGNAVKFTEIGGVNIDVVLLQDTDAGYTIRFSVQDTGSGISQGDQEKIFSPFVQVHGAVNATEGSGLGLAISQQAVQLLGGVLRVASAPGSGSRFWFDLTLAKDTERHPQDAPATAAAIASPSGPTAMAANKPPQERRQAANSLRVLLIDDNSTILFLLKELIQQDGHTVVTASSGEVALSILSDSQDFDLIVLDYNLGSMDGLQVLQVYRMGRVNPAPAWFLTADATRITEEKLRNSGAQGVLTKPIRQEALRAVLSQASNKSTDRSDTQGSPQNAPGRAPENKDGLPAHLRPVSVIYIDQATISNLRAVGRNRQFVLHLLSSAKGDLIRSTDAIAEAWRKKSPEDVRDVAHAIKSVCGSIGAVRLAAIAAAIMRADDDSLESSKQRFLAAIREVASNTIAALDAIIDEETRAASGF